MKTFALLAALAAFSLASAASALDLTTTDGKVYKDVSVTKLTPIGLKFICAGKSGWADFRDLTPDLQQAFNYDPKAAAAFEQKLVDNKGFIPLSQQTLQPAPVQVQPAQLAQQTQVQVQPVAAQEPDTQEALIAQQTPPDYSSYPADAQPVSQPPQGATVIDCSSGVPQTIDSVEFTAGPAYCPNTYVLWGGSYYPAYYWCHWWHSHNWVWHDGHYYPQNYYDHHGAWENGKYYPYEHGKLYQSEPWQKADESRSNFQSQYHDTHGGPPPTNFGGVHYHGGGRR